MTHDTVFEELYAEYTQSCIEHIVSARLKGGGYCLPSISKAWTWYRFGTADGYSKGLDRGCKLCVEKFGLHFGNKEEKQ